MSNTITVTVAVDAAAAVRAGRGVSGSTSQITLDLDALTEAERALLAESMVCEQQQYRLRAPYLSHDWYAATWRLSDPTPGGLRTALAAVVSARATAIAEQAERRRREIATYHAAALAVLAERRTKTVTRTVTNGSSRVVYLLVSAEWPYRQYDDPDDPQKSIKGVSWEESIAEANRRAVAEAETQAAAQEQARLAREAAESAEREAWIRAHGSDRLRRLLTEQIEHRAVYLDERLALERPGWQFERQVRGEATEARNVPESAFVLLDEARSLEPAARLVYWTIEHEHEAEACENEDCERYDYQGYAALATFLDRDIVYGVPSDYAI